MVTPIVLLRDTSQYARITDHVLRGTANTAALQMWVDGDADGTIFEISAAYSATSEDWYYLASFPVQSPAPLVVIVPLPCRAPQLRIRVTNSRVHAFTLRINEVKE